MRIHLRPKEKSLDNNGDGNPEKVVTYFKIEFHSATGADTKIRLILIRQTG